MFWIEHKEKFCHSQVRNCIFNSIVIAMYGVKGVVALLGLSLREMSKCLITILFCAPGTNNKNTAFIYVLFSKYLWGTPYVNNCPMCRDYSEEGKRISSF